MLVERRSKHTSIDEKDLASSSSGQHSQLSTEQVETYKQSLLILGCDKKSVEKNVRYVADPKTRAERAQIEKTVETDTSSAPIMINGRVPNYQIETRRLFINPAEAIAAAFSVAQSIREKRDYHVDLNPQSIRVQQLIFKAQH